MHIIKNLSVEIKISDLLTKVRANREQHVALYAEAKDNYLATVREGLEKTLAKLDAGEYSVTDYIAYTYSPPKNYTEVYDHAIAIFELDTRETILLDQKQFTSFVMDKWDWKNDFLLSNAAYVGKQR